MGCSGIKVTNAVNALKALKLINNKIKGKNFNQDNFYLITAKSIPKFLKKIEEFETKNNTLINNIENFEDSNLRDFFQNYKREQFIFLDNFAECWHLIKKSVEENLFIIADVSFMDNMSMDDESIIKKKVAIEVNVQNNFRRIAFGFSKKKIAFEEIENKILYKFVESDDNKSFIVDKDEDEDKFNPKLVVIETKNNKNVKSNENQKEYKNKETNNDISNEVLNQNKKNEYDKNNNISNEVLNQNKKNEYDINNNISNEVLNQNKKNEYDKNNNISNEVQNENKKNEYDININISNEVLNQNKKNEYDINNNISNEVQNENKKKENIDKENDKNNNVYNGSQNRNNDDKEENDKSLNRSNITDEEVEQLIVQRKINYNL